MSFDFRYCVCVCVCTVYLYVYTAYTVSMYTESRCPYYKFVVEDM